MDVSLSKEKDRPVFSGLDVLFLEVNNLEDSLGFYRDLLGLESESQADAESAMASVYLGGLRINLVQQVETMLKRGRGIHFVFGVDNVEDLYTGLVQSGVEINAPTDEGWGGRFISVRDPDGYRLFFVTWDTSRRQSERQENS
jgi:catechol 2,3-dioxygenase-like lactoylglutathione lyase family enzyme